MTHPASHSHHAPSSKLPPQVDVAIIGAGPAGLMAAEVLSQAGVVVHVFDAMPSVGRKFLLAGIGGLNLTHSEPPDIFATRYFEQKEHFAHVLKAWGATQCIAWAKELGIETFVGTSGRVFPKDMKAAPLLRAWLQRLRSQGVQFHMRQRWTGWGEEGGLMFASAGPALNAESQHSGQDAGSATSVNSAASVNSAVGVSSTTSTKPISQRVKARCTVLALGGGSWKKLGSDGAWVPWLRERGVQVADLLPSNCGFDVSVTSPLSASTTAAALANGTRSVDSTDKTDTGWSQHFAVRFAGQPFKQVAISHAASGFSRQGEFVATTTGLEGSLIYAVSAALRNEIAQTGSATITLDLLPHMSAERVLQEVSHPRGSRSLSSHLSSRLKLDGVKMGILYELLGKDAMHDHATLSTAIKSLPVTFNATRPIDEAISSAGGVRFDAMNPHYQLTKIPGVFCAGEMLDWEAPTGGYLLTAVMATGRIAGQGALAYLHEIKSLKI